MSNGVPRVNVPVVDRIMLHLWEHDHQADHYIVTQEVTRPGIAEVCAMHPPNVSRSMRELMSEGLVSEHTRSIRGEDRRQKTWQLTQDGREDARERIESLRSTPILIRGRDGTLLEVRADQAPSKLETNLSLLQVLMHAQHEGVLNFGDIRFGAIVASGEEQQEPGSITLLAGAHSTYDTLPPKTRSVHGRDSEKAQLDDWIKSETPLFVISGIAGCGKTTLASYWLEEAISSGLNREVMYYPCQPWDSPLGIATSLLHRIGITEESEDPYKILDIPKDYNEHALKKAYLKAALKTHPDRGGTPALFQKVSIAYALLQNKLKERDNSFFIHFMILVYYFFYRF